MGQLKFEPTNEMQTREWFAAHLDEFEYSIVKSGSAFPDYVLEDQEGQTHRVEAESESANFLRHGHDASGCDFVLCWLHNAVLPLPVLELSTHKMYEVGEVDQAKLTERVPSQTEKPCVPSLRLVAQEQARKETNSFIRCIAEDIDAHRTYVKMLEEPRLRLLCATELLIRALNDCGVDVKRMHPYDLFGLLVPQVTQPTVNTENE